jgi:hypothetical protein
MRTLQLLFILHFPSFCSEESSGNYEMTSRIASLQSTGELSRLPIPSVTLPEFWLYPGKLVMLPIEMLGKELPEFGHTIFLDKRPSRQLQQMYFTPPGQESSPVLITNQDKYRSSKFFGCALKGAFFLNHVLGNDLADFRVNSGGPTYYLGSMMDGTIRAILPRDNLFSAGLNRRDGDILKVYPKEFDLLLQGNYTGSFELDGKTLPIVSEIPDYTTTATSQLVPLFLLLDSSHYEESICQILDDASIPFCLLRAKICENNDTLTVMLSKGGLVASCKVDPEGWLDLESIANDHEELGAGIELPILIVPVEKEHKQAFTPCPESLILLDRFIERLGNMAKRQQNALAATAFFDNWMQALTFLQQEEGEQELKFSAAISPANERGEFLLPLPSPAEDTQGDIEGFWDSFAQECEMNPQKQMPLSAWHTRPDGNGYWKRIHEPIVRTPDSHALMICPKAPKDFSTEFASLFNASLFKLNFRTMQYVPLERQKNALIAMRDDRFANSELRDALLLPEEKFYSPTVSEFWKERLADETHWAPDPNELSENQKDVVRTCLGVEPLVMVQGPPGTGKTRCILEIVYQYLSHNPKGRVLISSQQNTAVDNVVERLVQHHHNFLEKNSISIMRIGNEEKMSSASQQFTFNKHLKNIINALSANADDDDKSLSLLRKHLCDFLLPKINSSGIDNEMLFCMTLRCQIVAATCVGLANKAAAMDQCRFDLEVIS